MSDRVLHVAEDRFVLTYEVGGWPVGVLTGVEEGDHVHLEHMILFPEQDPMYLVQMLAAALQFAEKRGTWRVTFRIDPKQPKAKLLERLAERHGFVPAFDNLWRFSFDQNAPARNRTGYGPIPPMPPDLAEPDDYMVRERELARLARERARHSMDCLHAVTTAVVGLGG